MFWADTVVDKIKEHYKDKIAAGQPIVIRDEKTASGRVHVGSLRGVAIHGVISELLKKEGILNTYFFEINDFDPMDGLPVYLNREVFLPYMGKPLCDVPSPDGNAKNYAEYFAAEFTQVISELGFNPTYYRSSDMYKSGRYNDAIRLALEHADLIREIYQRISGAKKQEKWLPLNVICEQCGKVGTTHATDFDGKTVFYTCGDFVDWAKGCGYTGRISPFDGRAKLPWKVEWAAKFTSMNVDVEGGGKDHSTRGGSRDIADTISREVFHREPPLNIPYEFFVVGGKKMSSSKGAGSSSREVADLLPPELLRFLLIQKEPQRVIDFIPDGDTVPVLYDTFDTYAKHYFDGLDDSTNRDDFSKIFELAQLPGKTSFTKRILPRFSQVAYLVQMPHIDPKNEIENLTGEKLDAAGIAELERREKYAKIWLDIYAPENYKFEIQKTLPALARNLSMEQRNALGKILAYMRTKEKLDGKEFHEALHGLRAELNMQPKDFFSAIYISILGKENGPKAGWFLSVLDKSFLEQRFGEVARI
jgi:lysyl-tRNA synthetase class 1